MSAPTNLLLLNRVSSFFARIVRYRVYSMRHLSTPQIFERLGLQSLSVRRQRHDMMFLYDIINGRVSCAPLLSGLLLRVPGRATRHTALFHVPRARTEVERRSLLHRIPSFFNTLPTSIDLACGRLEFSRKLSYHLNNT